MSQKLLLYTIGLWFLFMFLAIINAVIREGVYGPKLGEWAGHVISTVIFIAVIFTVVFLFLREVQLDYSDQDLLTIGTIWFLATICFEFLAGHYLFGNTWEELLHDYNLLEGRVWIFVPISLFSSPSLMDRLLR